MRQPRRIVLLVFVIAGLTVGQFGGILAQGDDPPRVVVGSLSFTESIILSEMLALLLEDAGYEVERRMDMGVSEDLHAALVDGEIDLYVEYTGGGLVAILGLPVPPPDVSATPAASVEDQVYATVSAQYEEQFGLTWLDEIGFNDSYALAVTRETADELGLETISDLQEHADEMTLATDNEFPDRQDGLVALEAGYGLEFRDVRPGPVDQMYAAIEGGEADVITAYTTDGRLPDLDLVLLEDDMHAFPPYYAAPVVNGELLDDDPALRDVLNQLAGRIDEATMAELNRRVDVEGQDPAAVARAFLAERGLI
jgi:glycine betaine/choline ABC-type transport system substrate-binding protein